MNGKKNSPSVRSEGKKTLKGDIILISCAFLIALLGAVALFVLRETGSRVIVSVDGDRHSEYPLSRDIRVVIESGESGDKHNTLVISDGHAYVSEADCPGHDCVDTRPISYEGETIICIPNRVVISIE